MSALEICQQWIVADPENSDGFFWLSLILLDHGKKLAALKASQTSVYLDKDDPRLLTQLAKCYLLNKNETQAFKFAKLAAAAVPQEFDDLDSLGVVFSHLGLHDKSVELFHRAIAGNPLNSQFHSNLGNSLHFCNKTAEAQAAFEQAVSLDAENYRAHWSISQLQKQSSNSNHIENLTALLDRPDLPETAQIYLSLALSKEHEDLDHHELSFQYLRRGNHIVTGKYPHDEMAESAYFDNLKRIFSPSLFGLTPKGFNTSAVIFIIGLPRTGTTLLEQILAQHSEVLAAGELQTFNHAFSRIFKQKSVDVTRRGWQEDFATVDFETLGREYLENTQFRVGDSRFFTDKYPHNYQLAGAIGLALPHAKIIHMTRNAMDTCFSNFKQLFSLGSCRYSYDLEAMGQHYIKYRSLMNHWHQLMPGKILDVAYEDLVSRPETSIRRVLKYCGLRWQDNCLEFHNSTRNVATASTAQVRQPLYRSGVGRWKYHAENLSPLVKLFTQNDISFD